MKRRELIAGLGSLAVVGTGGAYATGRLDGLLGTSGQRLDPVEVSTLDAPGSSEGTMTVPEEERVTYLSLFATWCTVCERKMDPLAQAAAAVDADVQFVSVTVEPVGRVTTTEDVAEWWQRHEGNWPVGYGALDLTKQFGGVNVPFSAVIDADNRLVWSNTGYESADTIRSHIREA